VETHHQDDGDDQKEREVTCRDRAVRRNKRNGQAEGLDQTTHFPEFEEVHYPEESLDDEQPLLYFLLREMSQTHTLQRRIEPDFTPSRLDKLPLVSFLWNTLRRQLHGLSIFYANKVAEQMISYHQYINIVLNLMIRQDQKRNRELTKLKQHVADLEARLDRLEHKS
jgi:hypothetical protein